MSVFEKRLEQLNVSRAFALNGSSLETCFNYLRFSNMKKQEIESEEGNKRQEKFLNIWHSMKRSENREFLITFYIALQLIQGWQKSEECSYVK